jgi:hypothetical protein
MGWWCITPSLLNGSVAEGGWPRGEQRLLPWAVEEIATNLTPLVLASKRCVRTVRRTAGSVMT